MTETTDSSAERGPEAPSESEVPGLAAAEDDSADAKDAEEGESKRSKPSAVREFALLAVIAITLYYLVLTFVARPYLIPSESMEPTLHGCPTCVGDRIMVDKLTYRFSAPQPGDVVVFRGPPSWNRNYKSIRSSTTAVRWMQNTLSFIGFVPPDENDLVKRVIAVGGQTVQCRNDTGLTVDGKRLDEPYVDLATINPVHLPLPPCPGIGGTNVQFGPVKVPEGRLWVMGDNRTHSADSRAHCDDVPADRDRGVVCTGDPMEGTVPVANVIGKTRFIVWPPSRWGGVGSVNPQHGQ